MADEYEIPKGRPEDLPPNMMMGPGGEHLLKWRVDYAKIGTAQCRDNQCLYRVDNGGSRIINKGELRIGRRVLMDGFGSSGEAQLTCQWYHARCIFHSFLRARKATRIIESECDIQDFQNIDLEDQALIIRMINGSEDIRKAAQNTTSDGTPQKDKVDERSTRITGLGGRRKRKYDDLTFETGQRIWAHYRSGIDRTKSQKPELGTIRSDEVKIDGTILIQFESNATKKTREDLYSNPKRKRTRGWNRYPRSFDGPKQWIPRDWLVLDRTVPPLCGCNKQIPDHACACTMTCTGTPNSYSGLVYGCDIENVTSHNTQKDALETLRKRLKESEARILKEAAARNKKGDDSD